MRAKCGLSLILFLMILAAGCTTTVTVGDLAGEYYNLANAYAELGDSDKTYYEKAISFYNEALKLEPGGVNTRYNLTRVLIKGLYYQEASLQLESLLAEDAENIDLLSIQAYLYYLQEEDSRALTIYQTILELSPRHIDSLYNAALICWRGERLEDAADYLQQIIKDLPEDKQTLFNLGKVKFELKLYEESIKWLEQYLELESTDTEAYLLLADDYRHQELYYKSLEIYDNVLALEEEPQRAPQADREEQALSSIWFERAKLLLTKVQDPEKGLSSLEQALEMGFRTQTELMELYFASDLLEQEEVTALLEKYSIPIREPQPPTSETKGSEGKTEAAPEASGEDPHSEEKITPFQKDPVSEKGPAGSDQ